MSLKVFQILWLCSNSKMLLTSNS